MCSNIIYQTVVLRLVNQVLDEASQRRNDSNHVS